MRDFIIQLLICSITMSALAICYMAVTPLLATRYSSKSRYYAWLIVVIGLIIPFRSQFDNPVVKVIPTDRMMPVLQMSNGTLLTAPNTSLLLPAASPDLSLTLWQIAAAVWLTGMSAFLLYHLVKHCRFLKKTRRWSDVITDQETLNLFQNKKAELGITKEIGLYQCAIVGTPLLTGLFVPKILLPDIRFTEDDLEFILNHELVHYKRKDLWYKCLVLLATALHWFNPLMRIFAREIDILCEMSCDSEVVNRSDADTRMRYSEAIIGVVRYQSKMKTALSTNFYGGKKGMKKRISSIMDMQNKKTGIAVLCGILILTMGSGIAFAANSETNSTWPEYIKEDIVISPSPYYSYKFMPSPDIYTKYSSYGISISDNGETLLYNGKQIKTFVDEHSDTEAFYYDEAGTVNLSVTRNSSGKLTGMNVISEEAAQNYRSAFFADDASRNAGMDGIRNAVNGAPDMAGTKYDQYSPYGITLVSEEDRVDFKGQRVRLLIDKGESEGYFYTFWYDKAGSADLSVVRNSAGQITQIENITAEKAQKYIDAYDE